MGQQGVWLTAAEILARLDVTGVEHLGLGACSTHADDPEPGDRLAGLLRAALYRGARSVQASLWPVRDDAAALVGAWTWEMLVAGEKNKARALRAAVLRLRNCTGPDAAKEFLRLAQHLPLDDPARSAASITATYLGKQARPFSGIHEWAPFVLHGAPLTAA